MIPRFVKSTCLWTAILAAMVCPYLLQVDRGAAISFAVASGWMIGNLLAWTAVIMNAIRPDDRDPLLLMGALFMKLGLLAGGFIALKMGAPYTRVQLLAIIAGISSIIVVAVLKAIGARLVAPRSVAKPIVEAKA